ncbi:hypothetical protein ACCO45_009804 [Purpureocillium lilacinum]|uniref:Uncharacterized protein n=1 Tax=Purpureocillium lilacinum TaxID=33203 RepID=A0ACC4DLS7_PURLI
MDGLGKSNGGAACTYTDTLLDVPPARPDRCLAPPRERLWPKAGPAQWNTERRKGMRRWTGDEAPASPRRNRCRQCNDRGVAQLYIQVRSGLFISAQVIPGQSTGAASTIRGSSAAALHIPIRGHVPKEVNLKEHEHPSPKRLFDVSARPH